MSKYHEGMITTAYKLATDASWVSEGYGFHTNGRHNKKMNIYTDAELNKNGNSVRLSYFKVPKSGGRAKKFCFYVGYNHEMVVTKGIVDMSKERFKLLRKRMREHFEEDNYLFNSWVAAGGGLLHSKGYIKDITEAEKAAQDLFIKALGMSEGGISSDEDEFA